MKYSLPRLPFLASIASAMLMATSAISSAEGQTAGLASATSPRFQLARVPPDCAGVNNNTVGHCIIPPDPNKPNDPGANLANLNCTACCARGDASRLGGQWVPPAGALVACTP